MLDDLRHEVCEANLFLHREGLVRLTWGNASGIDRDAGLFVIKPSGVPYSSLEPAHLVVVDLEGNTVEGTRNPSSDTPTHALLYREFTSIGGIAHTHSLYAVMFCQAGLELPCHGTTHADHFFGTVPLVRELSAAEVDESYERNTGQAIVECFRQSNLDPLAMPAALQRFHAPFTWGKNPAEAVSNSLALELCCQMALGSLLLNHDVPNLPGYLLQKHHRRKHGPDAYYGQRAKVVPAINPGAAGSAGF